MGMSIDSQELAYVDKQRLVGSIKKHKKGCADKVNNGVEWGSIRHPKTPVSQPLLSGRLPHKFYTNIGTNDIADTPEKQQKTLD